jgi:hypothetical protein
MSCNGYPYEWADSDNLKRLCALVNTQEVESAHLRIYVLLNCRQLGGSDGREVALGLGMVWASPLSEYDLITIAAALAASVYSGPERLNTLTIEAVATVGEAGISAINEVLRSSVAERWHRLGPELALEEMRGRSLVGGSGGL